MTVRALHKTDQAQSGGGEPDPVRRTLGPRPASILHGAMPAAPAGWFPVDDRKDTQ
jgi:hypothetical protein